MAGFKVVAVKSLPDGSLDLVDLEAKAEKHKENLAACMVWCILPVFLRD
jgi:glycine dehydrogenase